MNVHLGDLEEYVQEKLAGGGYGSAAEVIREALRRMRAHETEAAIERRLEAYVLRGLDQGPPEGVPVEDWDRRIAVVQDRMRRLVAEGIEQAERGELIPGDEAVKRIRDKRKRRRRDEP